MALLSTLMDDRAGCRKGGANGLVPGGAAGRGSEYRNTRLRKGGKRRGQPSRKKDEAERKRFKQDQADHKKEPGFNASNFT
jgi:hypothetical protein